MLAHAITLLLTLTVSAQAAYETQWDFRGKVPGSWDVRGMAQPQSTTFGLRINTPTDGLLMRDTNLTHPVQVVSLLVASAKPTNAILRWHPRGLSDREMVEFPFVIQQSQTPVPLDLYLSYLPEWDPYTDKLGIIFPAGSDILLQEIRLRGWTREERILNRIKSFWHLDEFRPYSINFLWGPLLADNPYQDKDMFQHLPPRAMSAVRWFYFALIAAAIVSLTLLALRKHSSWLLALPVTFVACWLLFDARMGIEIIGYTVDDWKRYVLPPAEEKELRTHGHFFSDLDLALPRLAAHEKFAVLSTPAIPAYAISRYQAYPAIATNDATVTGVTAWFVWENPNVGVDDFNRLLELQPNNSVRMLAQSGSAIQLSPRSFIYQLPR